MPVFTGSEYSDIPTIKRAIELNTMGMISGTLRKGYRRLTDTPSPLTVEILL